MPAPYDYYSQIQLVDPTARFMAGVQAAQQEQAAQQKLQRQQAFQQDLLEAYGSSNPVMAITNLMSNYPEAIQQISASLESMGKVNKQALKAPLTSAYNFILANQPQKAFDSLKTISEAYRNSGNESMASQIDSLSSLIVDDNEVNKISFGPAVFGVLGDDFEKIFKGQGLLSGIYEDEAGQISQEDKLRGEVSRQQKPFEDFDQQFLTLEAVFKSAGSNVYNSSAQVKKAEEGFSDIALITLFNKILDPRSVVRGEEFDNAANTAGLWSWGQTILKNLTENKGSVLTQSQRQAIYNIANYVKTATDKKKKSSMEDAYVLAARQKLNPIGIFGKKYDKELWAEARAFLAGEKEMKEPTPLADLADKTNRLGSSLLQTDISMTGGEAAAPAASAPAPAAPAPAAPTSNKLSPSDRATLQRALDENPNHPDRERILRALGS